ncbi:hypothetical protein RA210_U10633 [Rubrivivax sp. A210]|nr:hypothetical protein RA210_U10633 [Rubrivivax sp. A210]
MEWKACRCLPAPEMETRKLPVNPPARTVRNRLAPQHRISLSLPTIQPEPPPPHAAQPCPLARYRPRHAR